MSFDLRYYDIETKMFVYLSEFKINNKFEQMAAFFKKASFYAYKEKVDVHYNLFDCKGTPIFSNDIVLVPQGWSGDYIEYAHLDLIYWDAEDGFVIDKSYETPINHCEVITNYHESPTFIDYAEQITGTDKKKDHDFKKIFEEYSYVLKNREKYE